MENNKSDNHSDIIFKQDQNTFQYNSNVSNNILKSSLKINDGNTIDLKYNTAEFCCKYRTFIQIENLANLLKQEYSLDELILIKMDFLRSIEEFTKD